MIMGRMTSQFVFMIAVCGSGTALSAAQPPQTAIMDRIPGGRHVASTKALLNVHRKSQNRELGEALPQTGSKQTHDGYSKTKVDYKT
jgi:hypothetical protein